ncbi:ClbS/DfsB family four-helix bundle protein [Thiospirochaeta perfilievii]|uniref:ClbS/DfsB family four-helix bundle protein n=1 Tax=Thiospirochaeta perfilievii TaxID=252967 RepID=A0A5C1QDE4_9SPIO|nr:ClbS/DfsB family four-helix bundle protein [Thiospirochaeta perfilievii]
MGDILIHLYEWHQLLINWIKSNMKGDKVPFLPKPYTWTSYGEMNVEFWKKHQSTDLESSKDMVSKSHKSVLELIEPFSNEELFTKKFFDWTGTTSLGSYCVSALSSHYDWAIKKLKAHIKNI